MHLRRPTPSLNFSGNTTVGVVASTGSPARWRRFREKASVNYDMDEHCSSGAVSSSSSCHVHRDAGKREISFSLKHECGTKKYERLLFKAIEQSLENTLLSFKGQPKAVNDTSWLTDTLRDIPKMLVLFTTATTRLNNSSIPSDELRQCIDNGITVIIVVVRQGKNLPLLRVDIGGAHVPQGCSFVELRRRGTTLVSDDPSYAGQIQVLRQAFEGTFSQNLSSSKTGFAASETAVEIGTPTSTQYGPQIPAARDTPDFLESDSEVAASDSEGDYVDVTVQQAVSSENDDNEQPEKNNLSKSTDDMQSEADNSDQPLKKNSWTRLESLLNCFSSLRRSRSDSPTNNSSKQSTGETHIDIPVQPRPKKLIHVTYRCGGENFQCVLKEALEHSMSEWAFDFAKVDIPTSEPEISKIKVLVLLITATNNLPQSDIPTAELDSLAEKGISVYVIAVVHSAISEKRLPIHGSVPPSCRYLQLRRQKEKFVGLELLHDTQFAKALQHLRDALAKAEEDDKTSDQLRLSRPEDSRGQDLVVIPDESLRLGIFLTNELDSVAAKGSYVFVMASVHSAISKKWLHFFGIVPRSWQYLQLRALRHRNHEFVGLELLHDTQFAELLQHLRDTLAKTEDNDETWVQLRLSRQDDFRNEHPQSLRLSIILTNELTAKGSYVHIMAAVHSARSKNTPEYLRVCSTKLAIFAAEAQKPNICWS